MGEGRWGRETTDVGEKVKVVEILRSHEIENTWVVNSSLNWS